MLLPFSELRTCTCDLANRVGITMANISVRKNAKVKAIHLSTLEPICKALDCQPGDILEYKEQHRGSLRMC